MSTVKQLFRESCDFIAGITRVDDIPSYLYYPEVAFAGRSNVGKSTLLNALVKRKSLARTSKTPGCTRQLNFFLLGKKLALVDLPGYGYAKASKKDVQGWNALIKDYLLGRPNLKRVFLLIDSRHGLKKSDTEIMDLLDEYAVSYQVVLTKIDKQTAKGLEKLTKDIENLAPSHTALHPVVILTSSKNNDAQQLRKAIIELV